MSPEEKTDIRNSTNGILLILLFFIGCFLGWLVTNVLCTFVRTCAK